MYNFTTPPFVAAMDFEAIAASTFYSLIDLSDTTNFRHKETSAIILKALTLHAEKAADGDFDIWVGVVTEVDAENGSVEWIHKFHLSASGNPTDKTDRFAQKINFESSLDLIVNADTAGSEFLEYVKSNGKLSGNAGLQNDTGLAGPCGAAAGDTGKPGAGDLIVYVEEVADVGTIDFFIEAEYYTR